MIARIKREGAGFKIEFIGDDYDCPGGSYFVKEIEYIAETHVEKIAFSHNHASMFSGKIPMKQRKKLS